jgi:hypothetical protein
MATTLAVIEAAARKPLKEGTASFWTSAELIEHANDAIKDLWRSIVDLHQEHFLTVDETNVSFAANDTDLTGVPTDCYRVHLIEPRDTTTDPGQRILFVPKDYNSADFINARSMTAQDPNNGARIFYTVTQPGPPTGAPVVLAGPKLTSALNLRFVYVPTIATKVAADNNPIPGESDLAIKAWIVAYARAKEREDRSPDPNWLAIYATEKQNLLVSLTPRQTQEPEVIEDLFMGY